jgi:ATP:corrinoid adenosyltransferase
MINTGDGKGKSTAAFGLKLPTRSSMAGCRSSPCSSV